MVLYQVITARCSIYSCSLWSIVKSLYHTINAKSGSGKERRILIGPRGPAKAALDRNYLEVYWLCAGGLSAVNAIGTQLRDPINSGLAR